MKKAADNGNDNYGVPDLHDIYLLIDLLQEMSFNWEIIIGTVVGFFGAAFGSVGGVGGGGIFVPMLTLIIGFDAKSATAISKSTSTKAFLKGIETWKKESAIKEESAKLLKENEDEDVEYEAVPDGPDGGAGDSEVPADGEVTVQENVNWRGLGLLMYVWVAFLGLQIAKNATSTCSVGYWILNALQIPVAASVTLYEAVGLYKGYRTISSKGDDGRSLTIRQLVIYCFSGILAGMTGGLVGLGGGFIMGPLFLELGVPPQVSSATSTFIMTFSSSMSVVEYYMLKRFPVAYAFYFFTIATVSAVVGQHVVTKMIIFLGRASLIIFILAFMVFVSAISLGGMGIEEAITKIENSEYMGFDDLCSS